MNDLLILIWAVLIFASVAWYSFLLFYIGVKGGRDILVMTKSLRERNAANEQDTGA